MKTSLYIAKVLGLYYLFVGLGFLISGKQYLEIFQSLAQATLSTFVIGFALLVAGLAIAVFHNIWSNDWRALLRLLVGL